MTLLTIDPSTPNFAGGSSNSASVTISPPANSLLVAIGIKIGGSGAPGMSSTGGLTWTNRANPSFFAGGVNIWTAPCPTALSGITIGISSGGSEHLSLKVIVYTGAKSDQSGAAAGGGTAPGNTIPTTGNNSIFVTGGGNYNSGTGQPGPQPNNSLTIGSNLCYIGDGFWNAAYYCTTTTNPSIPSGTPTAIGTTSGASNLVMGYVEILEGVPPITAKQMAVV